MPASERADPFLRGKTVKLGRVERQFDVFASLAGPRLYTIKLAFYFRQAYGLKPTITDKLLVFLLRFEANILAINIHSASEFGKFAVIGDESLLLPDHDQLVLEKLIELFGVGLVMLEGKRMLYGLAL